MTTSDTSLLPGLCENCQRIDFSGFLPSANLEFPDTSGLYSKEYNAGKTYIREPDGTLSDYSILRTAGERSSHKLNLGSLEAMVARKEKCSLCQLIATMFKKPHERDSSSFPAVSGHRGDCEVLLQRFWSGSVISDIQSLPYKFHGPKGWKIHSMSLSCWSKGEFEDHVASLAVPSSAFTKEPTLLARYQPAQCDFALFKSWLQMCVTSHPECLQRPGDVTVPLRLIDVGNMCLVTFVGRERVEARYFALSYVWGGGPKEFVLTTENLQQYCCPNGLPTLPTTISDAITLTKKMGQKYLWVDSLCILSNAPHDKISQIPAMTSVYGNALLTIVAAAGQDATHGLPGVSSPRSSYEVTDIGRYQIVPSYLPFHGKLINTTTWATRAWTYQEMLLSPRSLIFFDSHVEWLCKCTEWLEEHDLEHPEFMFRRGLGFVRSEIRLEIRNYELFVCEYTRRNLTYETDIVDAFSGIMAAIDDDFFWAIPYSRFGEFLAWWSDKIPNERRNCDLLIPSWSWLSWKGIINMPSTWTSIVSLLAVYRWRSGRLEQICTPTDTSLPNWRDNMDKQPGQIIWNDDSEWTVDMDDIPSDVPLNENQLIFWTFTVAYSSPEECEYALVGHDGVCHMHTLSITWDHGIATRLGRVTFEVANWPFESAVKKLIIME